MSGSGGKLGWKAFGGLCALLAALVTRKSLTFVWTKVVGREPPGNPEHPDVALPEAIGWATLSGVAVAVARLVAMRQAARTWRRAGGELPPGLEEAEA